MGYIGFLMQCYFLSCRYGIVMFLTHASLKTKGVKIGFLETKISLSFQVVVLNLYTEQINTWTILQRLLYTLVSHFQTL